MERVKLPIFNFTIQNSGENRVTVNFDGDIVDTDTQEMLKNWYGIDTSVSFKSFRKKMKELDAQVYDIYINCPGGNLTEAMAMHDLLIEMQNEGKIINCIGRGIVASAATYILMASRSASMTENSWLMIHNVSGACYGDVNDMENYAVTLRKFNDSSRDFYAEHTGLSADAIQKMMDTETWMTAQEAMDKKFITQKAGSASFTNSIKKEDWIYNNLAVLNSYNNDVKSKKDTSNKTFKQMKKALKKFSENLTQQMAAFKPVEQATGKPMDQTALVNKMVEMVTTAMDAIGDEMETEVTQLISTTKGTVEQSVIDAAVKTALEAQMVAFKTDFDAAKLEWEGEITQAIGGPTKDKKEHAPAQEAVGTRRKYNA